MMGKCGHHQAPCVCNTVKRIVAAQNHVANRHCCNTSCEQSIQDLKAPSRRRVHSNTIIPFVLHCKGTCKPFIAKGIQQVPIAGYTNESWYKSLRTPFLFAKRFVTGSDCCVQVELLRPSNANGMPLADSGDQLEDFLSNRTPFRTIQFRKTGICLTIDLDCFCMIQCLAPTNPLPPYHPPC